MPATLVSPDLSHGLSFEDLYSQGGLSRLDGHFLSALQREDAALHERLVAARAAPQPFYIYACSLVR